MDARQAREQAGDRRRNVARVARRAAAEAAARATPRQQVDEFEIKLVDALCEQATPETAKGIAEKTWDLVHDRPDDDAVKKHVTEWHERLAKMSTSGLP